MNCWEVKKCGRQRDGANVHEIGECPASLWNAGQACWLVAGTFCEGGVQGTFAKKQYNCTRCDFFNRFDLKHRLEMHKKFISNKIKDVAERDKLEVIIEAAKLAAKAGDQFWI